ncbi:MAG: T9SS type B sorting domain-containing protein, partial [Gammaproteobacteria bacterium]
PNGTGGSLSAGTVLTASQTVYVYAETGTTPNCSTQNSFTVAIVQPPVPVQPADIRLCDDNADGIRCFNLTAVGAQVTAGNANLQVAFYLTATDAQQNNHINEITALSNYCTISAGHQTVYISVWDVAAPTCRAVTQLELYVDPRPFANTDIADFAKCDTDATPGTEAFTLADHIPAIVANPAGLSFTFYTSQSDAASGTSPITAVPYVSAGQTIWVVLENAAGCTDIASFDLVVLPLPAVTTPLAPRTQCVGANGLASFNLSSYIPSISGGIPGVTVTFHGSQGDADNDQFPLASPYQSAGGTIWVRLENASCYVAVPLDLIGAQGPALGVPQPIAVCDDNNDCFATFDLAQTATQEQIWGGPVPAGVTFTYYLTQTDAGQQNGINVIPNPSAYPNIDPCTQTVWVSVTAPGNTCNSVVGLQLLVRPRPEANEAVTPYGVCDTDSDGQGLFDLTSLYTTILNGMGPAGYTVQFFAQQSDIPASPITSLSPYTSGSTTLWVTVTDDLTGCSDTVTVALVVYPQPVVAAIPAYRLCDDDFDQQATFDLDAYMAGFLQPGQVATFHQSQADAGTGNAPLAGTYVGGPAEYIWVRVLGEHGCFVVTGFDIVVDPKPIPVLPPANSPLLTSCDVNNDGMGSFDLVALAQFMQGSVPAGQMVINFYLTQGDADSGQNAIPQSTAWVNPQLYSQTIVVGVNNPSTQNDCRSTWPLTLTVTPSTQVIQVDDLTECDTDGDGLAAFDLTVYETQILAAQTGSATYTIEYFTSQSAAQNGSPWINDPTDFDGTDGQVIWYRVFQGTCDGALGTITLQVNGPASLPGNLGTFTRCGETQGQNIAWDLTAIGAQLNLGTGYQLQYYHNLSDAQGGIGEILPTDGYVNQGVAESLVIAVTDLATGCRAYVGFTIVVAPLPDPRDWNAGTPGTLTACEDGQTGQGIFDISGIGAFLANGDTNMTFSYHPTLADAEAGTNAITDPLTAFHYASGTLYIRVEENTYIDYLTGQYCHVVVELQLNVNPSPDLETGVVRTECEFPSGSGQMQFDLTEAAPLVLSAGQNPADFTFAYADAGGPIATPTSYTNTSSPQAITVTVTNVATGCSYAVTFDLVVKPGADAAPYAFAPKCDDYGDLADGIALFDLTQADATVLAGQAAGQFTVSYYESQADALANTGAIPAQDLAAYESATATLWAVVYNLGTGTTPDPAPCYSVPVQVTLTVEPVPTPTISGGDTICVDNATNTPGAVTLTASPAGNYTYDWYMDGQPTGLTGQSIQVDIPGDYTVVLTSNSALACVSPVSQAFTVVESSQPFNASYTISGAFQDNQSVQITVDGVNPQGFEYSMDGGPWLANGGLFTNVGPGEHTVLVRSACGTSDAVVFTLINYPHFFTPNGDGFNEVWNTYGLANDGRTKIYIFDRYGKLIKQIAPDPMGPESGNGWDGTFNGKPMPSTDYWFLVEYPDPSGAMKEFRA